MSFQSEINFHRGQVLTRLANTYPSLPLTLIEGAQNAIDADADRIMLCVDLKTRMVVMADNGTGTTIEHFEEALASVGQGIKAKDRLGRFGLGLISPLTKCARFTFVSAPPGRRSANRWTFVQKELAVQHGKLTIPRDSLPSLPKLNRKFNRYATDEFSCEWRTMVHMVNVTQDKVVSLVDVGELENQIQTKLSQAMRRNKAMIRVVLIDDKEKVDVRDIVAINFTGEPLPVVHYDFDETGRVEFELYRAAKKAGGRSGKVSVMAMDGSDYPISLQEFVNQAWGRRATGLLKDSMKVLQSGYFEGVIRCEKLELHHERAKFVLNDALEMLYLVIANWYDEYGKVHYEIEQEQSRETRWHEIALKSGDHLREILALPEFARIWDGLMSHVEFGRLGDGHLEPGKGRPDGPDEGPTTRSGQGGAGTSKTPGNGGGSGGSRTREPRDRPGDKPIGVQGRGNQRRLVKGDSKGLWFGFESMPNSMDLWEFDRKNGALVINTVNPIWTRLDETSGRHLAKNAKWIQHLLEYLAIEVMHLLSHFPDEEEFEHHRSLLSNDNIKHYVEMFIIPTSR